MATTKLKIARIGNSRGVRLPAASLRRYRIGEAVLMEERSDGILLRPVSSAAPKLSWEETALEMAASQEDWNVWDATTADGLSEAQWRARGKQQAAEPAAHSGKKQRPSKRR